MSRTASLAGISGLAFLVLTFTGFGLAPLPGLSATAPEVRQFLASAHPAQFTAGSYAQVLAYTAILVFVAAILRWLRSWGHTGAAGALAVAGATVALASVAQGLALAAAAVARAHSLPGPTAMVLLDAATRATWLSSVGLALALIALGAALRATGPLPRWCAPAAIIIGALVAAAIPLAASGIAHVPATLADLWILVVSFLALRRRGTAPESDQAAKPSTAGAIV